MPIDWNSLIKVVVHRVLIGLLTIIAVKWKLASQLLAGDTVSIYGIFTFSASQIETWLLVVGIPTLASAFTAWIARVKLKRAANIALQLPKGATQANVSEVAEASKLLSTTPDPATLIQVSRSIQPR